MRKWRMAQNLGALLQRTIDIERTNLTAITEELSAEKPVATQWSRREELGHLIDSATNNHVRFVRATLEGEFQGPGYDQDGWVSLHGYQELAWPFLVDLWYRYNQLLAALVGQIPTDRLTAECAIGSGAPVTLGFVIEDYVAHMQHHIDHILRREFITQYPSAAR